MMNEIADFQFRGYKLTNIHFQLYPQDLKSNDVALETNLKIVCNPDDFNNGIVNVSCIINAQSKNTTEIESVFQLHVDIVGSFWVNKTISRDEYKRFLKLNGVATLMPFLRSAIANITQLANIPPVIIPLFNLYRLKDD